MQSQGCASFDMLGKIFSTIGPGPGGSRASRTPGGPVRGSDRTRRSTVLSLPLGVPLSGHRSEHFDDSVMSERARAL
eukprot:321215-Hanusia_phi.AAC.1